MALPLDINGQRFLSWLPRHLQEDEHIQGVLDVMAQENSLIETGMEELEDQFIVATATWGLRYWEALLLLPIEPAGQDYASRRIVIQAKLQARRADSGEKFHAALASVTVDYSLFMDFSPTGLFVTITYNPDAYVEAQLEKILTDLVPAHIPFNIQYQGFMADISEAGDQL